MPKFDDRFARQNRCEPPPEFPLASPYSGIVHHLSGPNIHALTRIHPRSSGPVDGAPCGSHLHSLSLRSWVCHPKTRTYVRLLGPCFKTGRLKPLRQHPKCEGVRRPARGTLRSWIQIAVSSRRLNTPEGATFLPPFSGDPNPC